MNLKIAICDDMNEIAAFIESVLLKNEKELGVTIETDVFLSDKDLMKELKNDEKYDIIFLDIELQNSTGIDIGNYIRNERNDERTKIIFISGKTHYTNQMIHLRPQDFLQKPLKEEDIVQQIQISLKLLKLSMPEFTFKASGKQMRCFYYEILYFQSLGHKIHIVTLNGEWDFYGRLEHVKKQMNPSSFLNVHKSYFVNSQYVMSYAADEIVMRNGKSIPISRPHKKQIQKELLLRRGELL